MASNSGKCTVDVYFAKVPPYMKDQDMQDLLQMMNKDKANKLRRYQKRDQYRSAIGEMIVRKYICRQTNVKDMTFHLNKYGKPYLAGIEFNISHSDDWVACAISTHEIGIDIEKIADLDTNIAHQYFHSTEVAWMESGTEEEKLRKFYYLWTKKESFIKAIGKGLYMDLHSFVIKKDGEQSVIYIDGEKYKAQLIDIPYINGYDCSCCILTSKQIDLSINKVDTDELMNEMIRRGKN